MFAAKTKTAPSSTAASTDVNERIRKHQQQQQHQQQDGKVGNSAAAPSTDTDPPQTSSTAATTTTGAPEIPTKPIPTTAIDTATTLQGAVGARVDGGVSRRNRTKKMRSASGDDFKPTLAKRKPSAKEIRHVNFISPNIKSKAAVSNKLIKKSTSGPNASKTADALPTVSKSKSILKVKQTVVLKRKSGGSSKVSKKSKKEPQGAQAEAEAAALSKLAQQFTRTFPEVTADDAPMLSTRSASQVNSRHVGKKNHLLLKRRYSAVTKHLTSGAGIVESESVNVPPVRRFSPVNDKTSFSDGRDVKVYGEGNFVNDAVKMIDLPTTSRNITVAMVKEEHNKQKANENNTDEQAQQQQQVTNETPSANANANTTNIWPIENVANIRRQRQRGSSIVSAASTVSRGSVSSAAAAVDIPGLVDAQIVMPIDDNAGAITGNNTRSSKKGKVNEESAAKPSTEAAAVAGPSTSSESAEDDKDKEEDKDAKKKKNRCAECRKKVGLTGFQCRCGGLYCAVHRYSDKHDCTFNYREHGAQEIRRNNPVVVGEKIQKI
ncbi:uncharacterized protein drn isoform X1 [Eurosta solidaginis]|uniref:uncharacterized protein drn isoform X1 n=1 Tax=Eurosta solidaginis TaxID=178769 RepID=UPI003531275B